MAQIQITVNTHQTAGEATGYLRANGTDKWVTCQRLVRMIDAMAEGQIGQSMSVAINGGSGAVQATGTLTGSSVAAGATATVGVTTFTAIASGTPTSTQFLVGVDDTHTMANLAAAINANASEVGVATATSAAAVVTVTATQYGNVGNAIALAGGTGITASGSHLSGGVQGTVPVMTFSGIV